MALQTWNFNSNNSSWTLPHGGKYQFIVNAGAGGRGGNSGAMGGTNTPAQSGQLGSRYVGNIEFFDSEPLQIVVGRNGSTGGTGGNSGGGGGGGGGGGSSSIRASDSILIMAQGGRGGTGARSRYSGGGGSGGSGGSPDGGRGSNATYGNQPGGGGNGGGSNQAHSRMFDTSLSTAVSSTGSVTINLLVGPPLSPEGLEITPLFSNTEGFIKTKRALSGESIEFSWNETTDPQDFEFWYEAEWFDGVTWIPIISDSKELSATIKIPSSVITTENAQVRVRAYNHLYRSAWTYSDTFTIAQSLFFIKHDQDFLYPEDESWKLLNDSPTKEDYILNGFHDPLGITESQWSSFNHSFDILGFSNERVSPKMDIDVPDYEPLHHLNKPSVLTKSNDVVFNIYATPYKQVVKQKESLLIETPSLPDSINLMRIYGYTEDEASTCRILISFDNQQYFTWSNGWHQVGLENIWEQGMDLGTINSITPDSWKEIYNPLTKELSVVYALDINDMNTILYVDRVQMNLNIVGSWIKAKKSIYSYQYLSEEEMRINLLETGSYKINY